MRATGILAATVLVIAVALAGCGSESEGSNGSSTSSGGSVIEYDEQLGAKLVGIGKRGETHRLAELTNFAWDKVYVYSEGASADRIERDVGSAVLSDNYYYTAGNLLVFTRNGEVLHAISVTPDRLTWKGTNVFGPGAKLRPAHPNAQSGLIRIQEPAPSA